MIPFGIEYRVDKANGTCTLQNLTDQGFYYLQVDSSGHLHTGDLGPQKSMTLQGVVKNVIPESLLGKNTTETEERYHKIQLLVNNLVRELENTSNSRFGSPYESSLEFGIICSENLEGFVYEIKDGTLFVDFYDVNDEDGSPSYQAKLQKNSFSDREQSQLEVGAKIRAKLTKSLLPNGVEKYMCEARLIPVPTMTEEEYKEAYEEAYQEVNEFFNGLGKHGTA